MRGLRVLESVLTVKNLGREAGVGLWAWGLLARCRERGEMGSEDVGVLREVGKRAAWVLRGLRGGRREGVEVENADGEGEDGDGGADGEEQDGREEDLGGKAQVGDVEEREGGGCDDGQLGEREDPEENHLIANPKDPSGEAEDVLARAKQSLLSSIQHPPSPSRTENKEPSPQPAPPEDTLPTQNDVADHAVHATHASKDNPAATLSTHAQNTQRDELDVYATLDMIITVVGEFYGQRDLLEGRDLWDEIFEGG